MIAVKPLPEGAALLRLRYIFRPFRLFLRCLRMLCRIGIGHRIGWRQRLEKTHLRKVTLWLALVSGIVAAVATQTGFRKHPVTLPLFGQSFSFNLLRGLAFSQHYGLFLAGDLLR
ncbi:hypothetical protein D1872_226940 [compost metagenome]